MDLVKTENPVSSRKIVNLTVVACIGVQYLGKPVFLCENSTFDLDNSFWFTSTDLLPVPAKRRPAAR